MTADRTRPWTASVASVALVPWLHQPSDAAAGRDPPAASEQRERAADGPVVFVIAGDIDEASAQAALRTVRAHTAGLSVPVIVERPKSLPDRVVDQIDYARSLADRHGARGVFWLVLDPDEDLLLFLVEPDGLRALVRRVPREQDSDAAAFETLGVIAGSTADALVAGQEIGMTEVEVHKEVEREPPTGEPSSGGAGTGESAAPKRPWSRLRIGAGYVGNSFSDRIRWQNGIGVAIDYRPIRPFYLGVGFDAVIPSRVADDLVDIELRRYPVDLHLGYAGTLPARLTLSLEVAGTVDVVERRAEARAVPAEPDARFVLFEAGARAKLAYNPWSTFELNVLIGFDAVFNNVDYVVEDQTLGRVVVVDTHTVRALVGAGVSYGFL